MHLSERVLVIRMQDAEGFTKVKYCGPVLPGEGMGLGRAPKHGGNDNHL